MLRPLHPFLEIHLTTLLNLVSYSSPFKVLFFSLSSLLWRLASRLFRVASSIPTLRREGFCTLWTGGGTKDCSLGEVDDDADVEDRVRCFGTVKRGEEV
jgi:hypothetical protein